MQAAAALALVTGVNALCRYLPVFVQRGAVDIGVLYIILVVIALSMLAGAVTVIALVVLQATMRYIELFSGLEHIPPEDRVGFFGRWAISSMNQGLLAQGIMLAVLFLALVVAARHALPWSRSGALKNGILSVVILVVTGLPLALLPAAMSRWDQLCLPWRLTMMHPASTESDAADSFYLDRQPRPLAQGRKGLFMVLTKRDREDFSNQALRNVLAGGEQCPKILSAALATDKQDRPARCITAIEARLYCEAIDLRLPTPEEWDAALKKTPIETPEDSDSPFTREPFAEWTMRLVHGNPMFELKGVEGVEGAPSVLKPDEFSKKVGFRCAFSFGN